MTRATPSAGLRAGYGVLDTISALVVMSAAAAAAAVLWSQQIDLGRARALADRQAEILAAANKYIGSNFQTLSPTRPEGRSRFQRDA